MKYFVNVTKSYYSIIFKNAPCIQNNINRYCLSLNFSRLKHTLSLFLSHTHTHTRHVHLHFILHLFNNRKGNLKLFHLSTANFNCTLCSLYLQ